MTATKDATLSASAFLRAFFRDLDPRDRIEIRTIDSRGKVQQEWFTDPDEAAGYALRLARRVNVYYGVNAREGEHGDNAHVFRVWRLHADIDEKDFTDEPIGARAALARFSLAPSVIVRSGGGLQPYWLLAEPVDGDTAAALLRRLCAVLGSDGAAKDPARILRVPGTLNYKYDPARFVIATGDPERRYTLAEIEAALGPAADAGSANGHANGHSRADIGEDEPIPVGLRHRTLMSLAGTMRKRQMSAAAILAALLAENAARCQPPLDEAEVRSMAYYAGRYEPGEPTRFSMNGYEDGHEEQAAETESEEPTPQTEPEAIRPNLNDYSRTDTGNAEALAALFGRNLRYDDKRKEWLTWSRHRWRRGAESRAQVLAKRTAIARYNAAPDLPDRSDQQKASRWGLASLSRQRREAMVALARYERPILDSGEGWDADPFLLGVANGVVELRTGELRDGRREDKITMQSRAAYDPDARAPRWEQFLAEVFPTHPELIDWLQRCVGYSITGDTSEQVLFMPFGDGGNGKGALFRALNHALGDYAHTMPFAALEHHDRGNGATNDIADLVGRRFVMASETSDGRRFHEGRVKSLTGEDEISARHLYKDAFRFRPVAKYWLAFNHKPIVRDDSWSFWRRVRLIPFLAIFEGEREDKTLEATLQGEAAGILAWAVRGCLAWQREGLTPPLVVSEATEEYRHESDPLREFLAERCVIEDGASITASDIYAAYESWAGRAPDKLSRTMFGRLLARKFPTRHRKWGREYVGIRRKMGD